MNAIEPNEDERFAGFLRDTVRGMDPRPDAVPRDAMWAAIAAQREGARPVVHTNVVADASVRRATPAWFSRGIPMRFAMPVALSLMVGGVVVGLSVDRGRTSPDTAAPTQVATAPAATPTVVTPAQTGSNAVTPAPQVVASATPSTTNRALKTDRVAADDPTADYFKDALQLVAAARAKNSGDTKALDDAKLAAWANQLLAQTQLLIDTRVGQDPERLKLLRNLELVLLTMTSQLSPEQMKEAIDNASKWLPSAKSAPRQGSA